MENKKAKTNFVLIGLVVVLAALVFLVVGNSFNGNVVGTSDPIKIGVIGHFSGEYAVYGVPMKNAAELYVSEVNQKGGIDGRQIQLIVEDDGADAVKAATAMNKLINVDGVDYVISAQGSGATSVIAPIAQDNQKILMVTLGSAPGIPATGDYIFRSVPSDVYQGTAIVDFVQKDLGSKSVAGLYVNDVYGVGVKDIVNKNIDTVSTEMFEPGVPDIKTQLIKIKNSNPDTIVIIARDEFPMILKQIKELDIDAEIIASETFKGLEIKGSEQYAEGVYVPFTIDPVDYVQLTSKYYQMFGVEPSPYSMYAYDGTAALVKAIDQVNDDKDLVKVTLKGISFNGASENVGFDNEGERTGTRYVMYQYTNGDFVRV
jgi:branched-chain amino acid transport system substrate-binding protein